ncbi:hypothetical protein ACHQM5_023245 [Ranunculus cassubicifolius]
MKSSVIFFWILVFLVFVSLGSRVLQQIIHGSSVADLEDQVVYCEVSYCLQSLPPQCGCLDIKSSCHSFCDVCNCTNSIPPKCHCLDVKPYDIPRKPCPYEIAPTPAYLQIVSDSDLLQQQQNSA